MQGGPGLPQTLPVRLPDRMSCSKMLMTTASFFEVPEHDELVSTHAHLAHAILATRSSGDTRSLIALLTMMAELSVNYWPPNEDGRQYRDALCTEAISLIEQTGFDEYLPLALRLLATVRPIDDGVALARRALDCARRRADKAETSRCLLALGNLCVLKGDVVGGTRSTEEGLELARKLENDDALAYALYVTAVASDKNAATKRALYSEAVGICVRNRRYSIAGTLLRACAFLACEDDAREQRKTLAAACEMFALDGNIDDERFSLQQLFEICDENVDGDLKSYCEDRLRRLPTHDSQPVDGVGIEHLQRLSDACLHNERGSQADELHAAAWAILQAAKQQ